MRCEKWIISKYNDFYKKNEYIPPFFNPYNVSELKEVCSTISTSTGAFTGVGTVLIATKKRRQSNEK